MTRFIVDPKIRVGVSVMNEMDLKNYKMLYSNIFAICDNQEISISYLCLNCSYEKFIHDLAQVKLAVDLMLIGKIDISYGKYLVSAFDSLHLDNIKEVLRQV